MGIMTTAREKRAWLVGAFSMLAFVGCSNGPDSQRSDLASVSPHQVQVQTEDPAPEFALTSGTASAVDFSFRVLCEQNVTGEIVEVGGLNYPQETATTLTGTLRLKNCEVVFDQASLEYDGVNFDFLPAGAEGPRITDQEDRSVLFRTVIDGREAFLSIQIQGFEQRFAANTTLQIVFYTGISSCQTGQCDDQVQINTTASSGDVIAVTAPVARFVSSDLIWIDQVPGQPFTAASQCVLTINFECDDCEDSATYNLNFNNAAGGRLITDAAVGTLESIKEADKLYAAAFQTECQSFYNEPSFTYELFIARENRDRSVALNGRITVQ